MDAVISTLGPVNSMKTKLFVVTSTVAVLCFTGIVGRAAEKKGKSGSESSSDTVAKPMTEKQKKAQEKKLRKELETPYKKWLNEDVTYIITDEERKAFKNLQTDEERQQFVEQFWLRRDPTPDTERTNSKKSTTAASPMRTSITLPASRVGRRIAEESISPTAPPTKSNRIRPAAPMSALSRKAAALHPLIRSRNGAIAGSKGSAPTLKSSL